MLGRALLPVLGVLVGCLVVAAQQTNAVAGDELQTISLEQLQSTGAIDVDSALALYQPDTFSKSDRSVSIYGFPALTLLDGRRFLISGPMGRLSATDLVPVAFLSGVHVQKLNASPMDGTDSPGVLDMRLNRSFTGGEFGVFYGRSEGKFGYEEKQAHILGSVGNEAFQITVGAVYEEASGHLSRQGH